MQPQPQLPLQLLQLLQLLQPQLQLLLHLLQPQELLFEFKASNNISKIFELFESSVPVDDAKIEINKTDKISCEKFIFTSFNKNSYFFMFSVIIQFSINLGALIKYA